FRGPEPHDPAFRPHLRYVTRTIRRSDELTDLQFRSRRDESASCIVVQSMSEPLTCHSHSSTHPTSDPAFRSFAPVLFSWKVSMPTRTPLPKSQDSSASSISALPAAAKQNSPRFRHGVALSPPWGSSQRGTAAPPKLCCGAIARKGRCQHCIR